MTASEDIAIEDSQSPLQSFRWGSGGRWLGAIALVAVLGALWLLGGNWGVIAWAVIALCWFLFPPIVPVAVGQFALVALAPVPVDLVTVAPVEAALLGLLIADIADDGIVAVLILTGLAGVMAVGVIGLLQASGFLVAAITLLGVLLHRPILEGLRQFIMPQ